jgi:hypothetical protein
MMSERTVLTPEERLRVAAAHHCSGIAQHELAFVLGINSGRIAEATMALWMAAQNPKAAIEAMRASGKFEDGQ